MASIALTAVFGRGGAHHRHNADIGHERKNLLRGHVSTVATAHGGYVSKARAAIAATVDHKRRWSAPRGGAVCGEGNSPRLPFQTKREHLQHSTAQPGTKLARPHLSNLAIRASTCASGSCGCCCNSISRILRRGGASPGSPPRQEEFQLSSSPSRSRDPLRRFHPPSHYSSPANRAMRAPAQWVRCPRSGGASPRRLC